MSVYKSLCLCLNGIFSRECHDRDGWESRARDIIESSQIVLEQLRSARAGAGAQRRPTNLFPAFVPLFLLCAIILFPCVKYVIPTFSK